MNKRTKIDFIETTSFSAGEKNALRSSCISDCRNVWIARRCSGLFYGGKNRTRLSSGNHASGIFLRISGCNDCLAGSLSSAGDRPAAVPSHDSPLNSGEGRLWNSRDILVRAGADSFDRSLAGLSGLDSRGTIYRSLRYHRARTVKILPRLGEPAEVQKDSAVRGV